MDLDLGKSAEIARGVLHAESGEIGNGRNYQMNDSPLMDMGLRF